MFNAKHGFAEAYVRGCQIALLQKKNYLDIARCETLEDVKSYLQTTSRYVGHVERFLGTLKTTSFVDCCRHLQALEFKICCTQAAAPLSKFLEYLTYGYMIDNIVLVLTGILRGRTAEEILENCNPLGNFDSLPTVAVSNTMQDLYRLVLVDTPLAKYFSHAIASSDLDELNIELIRNVLYKQYLQDFMEFCAHLDDKTRVLMKKLLSLEADRHAIRITVDSLGTEMAKSDKLSLYADFGTLYPEDLTRLANCETMDDVRAILSVHQEFRSCVNCSSAHDLDRELRVLELRACRETFREQFNLAIFYAFMKFQENEVSNLMWLTECIVQGRKDRIHEGIIFCDS